MRKELFSENSQQKHCKEVKLSQYFEKKPKKKQKKTEKKKETKKKPP